MRACIIKWKIHYQEGYFKGLFCTYIVREYRNEGEKGLNICSCGVVSEARAWEADVCSFFSCLVERDMAG